MDNYHTDHRVLAAGRDTTTCLVHDDNGDEHELPTRWSVCPTCNGNGTHVNPSIDCNGLTSDDFANDPDFAESYHSGVYDVQCYGCEGRRVVAVVDTERCTPEELEAWESSQRADREYERECAMERRFGC